MDGVGRLYRNPPVVEALAELYFKGSAWDLTIPGSFYERVKDRFPNKSQMDVLALEVQVDQSGARTHTSPADTRMVFRSEDEARLVQVGRDVLVVNQVRPYPRFEAWSPDLIAMLGEYQELARPTGIDRLGLRYINRIVIPEQRIKTEDYLRIYPEVPSELGAAHGSFLVRLELVPRHTEHQLLLTLSSAPPERPDQFAIVLDLYDTVSFEADDAAISVSQRLSDAHDNVQWVFERTITDATRAIFGEVGK